MLNISIKMQSDHFAWLFDLHAQESLHKASSCDFKILLIESHNFIAEPITGWNMHHIVHKQSMNDEVRTLALHENSLPTVYLWVSILLHPVQDANMPSSGGLFRAIHAFEK